MAVRPLTPLSKIAVPSPRPDQSYTLTEFDRTFSFRGLKALLGAADVSKAGDRHARLAARDDLEREAARTLLSGLTLEHLFERPLTNAAERVDDVMRVNYDVDTTVYHSLSQLTLGEFKNELLRRPAEQIARWGHGLTGPMAAAVAKICDVHELILLAKKMPRCSRARTTLGLPGTLASRLQPNHPTDDLRGVTLLVYWGLSLGAGDALWGMNPAVDTVESVAATLTHLDALRKSLGVPTQICVLSHIKTQLACLAAGAPVEILFQSLAGTESTLTSEFDVTVELLDEGYHTMQQRGPLRQLTEQCMYFETGQGSEFTYGKHDGIDMTTAEALCYGLARRYDPFMVNNVTGFIGPETHRDNFEMMLANLQDHFMGKLLGLPMGMAPCYTLHSHIRLEGQQMATQLLTSAGANYYMDVALNTDRMLAYFDTSAHDDQTLREIHGLRPAPEFLAWAIKRGIFARNASGQVVRGANWGDARQFCQSDEEFESLRAATPACYGLDTAGPRPADEVSRQARRQQAVGRLAIQSELDFDLLSRVAQFRVVATQAASKEAHLNSPQAGALLDEASRATLQPTNARVQIVVTDGLSAEAVHAGAPPLLQVLFDALRARQETCGQPLVARYGRVKLAEAIAEATGAELVVMLVGERPGGDAQAARSLSAYLVYHRRQPPGYEYTVISNIHAGGLPPLEAGAVVAERVFQILHFAAAGNRLEAMLADTRKRPETGLRPWTALRRNPRKTP